MSCKMRKARKRLFTSWVRHFFGKAQRARSIPLVKPSGSAESQAGSLSTQHQPNFSTSEDRLEDGEPADEVKTALVLHQDVDG